MELNKQYSIAYKGLKNSSFDFVFEVDNALFAAYECRDIRGGKCRVEATMLKAEHQLDFDFTIEGEVICECDRCLEDCPIAIDYEGDLVVKFSDETDYYDGDVMWISPADDVVDLTQYIYESIVLSLPYSRVHEEGECNPEMLASFTEISEEELEKLEAQAEESDVVGLDDYNKSVLEALKDQMERNK